MPIRVLRLPRAKYPARARTDYIWNKTAKLRALGIEVVQHNPDVIVLGVNATLPESWLDAPVIIENCTDGPSLSQEQLRLAENRRVIGVFRNVVLRDPSLYTSPQVNYDYLGYYWQQQTNPEAAAQLNPQAFSPAIRKIRLVYPIGHDDGPYGPERWKWSKEHKPLAQRPIDVNFIGRMFYADRPHIPVSRADLVWYKKKPIGYPTFHRRALAAIWPQVPGRNEWDTYEVHHKLRLPDYLNRLAQCKVAVSPWGWGAWNIRDIECMLCRCVIIKPACPQIQTWPDVISAKRMVFCRPDFADLPEVTQQVLDQLPKYQQMVEANYKWLRDLLFPVDKVLVRWAENIREVLDAHRPHRLAHS